MTDKKLPTPYVIVRFNNRAFVDVQLVIHFLNKTTFDNLPNNFDE